MMANQLKGLVARFVKKLLYSYGVSFESDLPPEFIITIHAEQRLIERMGLKKKKIPSVVMKAWLRPPLNSEEIQQRKNWREYYNGKKSEKGKVYKELMGYVFVFKYAKTRRPLPAQKVLITVFN